MTDTLDGPDGPVEVTLIDAGAPVVIVPADAVGLTGNETPSEVDARPDVLALLEDLRRQGAVRMALAADKASAARAIPKLALVAEASGDDADLTVRMASMGKVHPALAITGSVALTMAAREPGSVIAQRMPALTGEEFRMATPAGVVTTWTGEHSGAPFVRVLRTTRRLAEATLILPDREVTPPAAFSTQIRTTSSHSQRSAHTRRGWWRPMNHSADSPSEDMAATPPSSQVEHIEHPPVDRKTSVTIMAVFIPLAVAAVVFGGNLLNPASCTTDEHTPARPWRCSSRSPRVVAPTRGRDSSAPISPGRYPAHPASSPSTTQVVKASRALTGSWRRPRTTEPSCSSAPRPLWCRGSSAARR